jgi:hypothetical protein
VDRTIILIRVDGMVETRSARWCIHRRSLSQVNVSLSLFNDSELTSVHKIRQLLSCLCCSVFRLFFFRLRTLLSKFRVPSLLTCLKFESEQLDVL